MSFGEFGPVAIVGNTAYGLITPTPVNGYPTNTSIRCIDFGNVIGHRDIETKLFRCDPIKTGFTLARPDIFGDRLIAASLP